MGSRKSITRQAIFNPRAANEWSKDDNKFGQKMLEKMGWKPGQGIGANNQGITENIKMSLKVDTKGLGYKKKDEQQWLELEDNFSSLLLKLKESDSTKAVITNSDSLEMRSQSSKARLHYRKFTRGKDLSKYGKKDLSCILGIPYKAEESALKEASNVVNAGTIDDYFKKKRLPNSSSSQGNLNDSVLDSEINNITADNIGNGNVDAINITDWPNTGEINPANANDCQVGPVDTDKRSKKRKKSTKAFSDTNDEQLRCVRHNDILNGTESEKCNSSPENLENQGTSELEGRVGNTGINSIVEDNCPPQIEEISSKSKKKKKKKTRTAGTDLEYEYTEHKDYHDTLKIQGAETQFLESSRVLDEQELPVLVNDVVRKKKKKKITGLYISDTVSTEHKDACGSFPKEDHIESVSYINGENSEKDFILAVHIETQEGFDNAHKFQNKKSSKKIRSICADSVDNVSIQNTGDGERSVCSENHNNHFEEKKRAKKRKKHSVVDFDNVRNGTQENRYSVTEDAVYKESSITSNFSQAFLSEDSTILKKKRKKKFSDISNGITVQEHTQPLKCDTVEDPPSSTTFVAPDDVIGQIDYSKFTSKRIQKQLLKLDKLRERKMILQQIEQNAVKHKFKGSNIIEIEGYAMYI